MQENDANDTVAIDVRDDSDVRIAASVALQDNLTKRANSVRVHGENMGLDVSYLMGVVAKLVDRIDALELLHKSYENYFAMDTFNPADYVRKDDFRPFLDEHYVSKDDFNPDEYICRNDFDPDDYEFENFKTESEIDDIVERALRNATFNISVEV